jgi:hypothetical protein
LIRPKRKGVFLLSPSNNNLTPENILDRSDPGDDVQKRFRYQHAYGVILLTRVTSTNDCYTAIWCEHHDDFLAQKPNDKFDSYQVKTRQAGQPPWRMNDEPFLRSLRKFLAQDKKFPNQFDFFHFVSNHTYFETDSENQLARSPIGLKQALEDATDVSQVDEPFASLLKVLAQDFDYSIPDLFSVLQRLRLVQGPSLNDFEDAIAHTHIPTIPTCASLSPPQLDALRDELIHRVFVASSLQISDPSRHWCCVAGEDRTNPRLKAKRITADDILQVIADRNGPPFRFAPADRSIHLSISSNLSPLEKKAIKGGLLSYLPTWKRRTLSAERHLLEMVNRKKKDAEEILNHLHAVVKGECDDARLQASSGSEPYGEDMMRILLQQLRQRATQRPSTVFNQEYDCLVGISGLLTNECEVWWSPEFNIEETT